MRSAVQEEKINGIQSDVKDIKEDVKDLRKDLDEIKNLIIKGIRENNEREDF
jgi:peptidoglycan hydrolase CwlO-like protein